MRMWRARAGKASLLHPRAASSFAHANRPSFTPAQTRRCKPPSTPEAKLQRSRAPHSPPSAPAGSLNLETSALSASAAGATSQPAESVSATSPKAPSPPLAEGKEVDFQLFLSTVAGFGIEPAPIARRQELLGRPPGTAGFHANVVSYTQHEIKAELATSPYCPCTAEAAVGHQHQAADEGFEVSQKLMGESLLQPQQLSALESPQPHRHCFGGPVYYLIPQGKPTGAKGPLCRGRPKLLPKPPALL